MTPRDAIREAEADEQLALEAAADEARQETRGALVVKLERGVAAMRLERVVEAIDRAPVGAGEGGMR